MKTNRQNTERRYLFALLCGVVALCLLNLPFSLFSELGRDEVEHIHSAWYVEQGHTPYVDFFQHHHPLLWYVILPFLHVFGHTLKTAIALRLLMLLLTLGIAGLAYSITARITKCRAAGLVSVVMLVL